MLAEVWRSQPPLRGLAQGVSSNVLEKHVFSKPYFEREGLIVAEENGRILGFVHGGFGPTNDLESLAYETGVVSRLMVVPHEKQTDVATQLLAHAETYLRERGVKQILAGGWLPHNPFYLGLYGGSRLPGILHDDEFLRRLFERNGYHQVGEQRILQCRLAGFRPQINRQQMTVRRRYQITAVIDPIPVHWWDACTLGVTDRTKFLLTERQGGQIHGHVTFWDIEPLASSWGIHAMGLYDLFVAEEQRRQGLATFLVGEALRQLQSQGITVAEVQVRSDDETTSRVFTNMGFEQIDFGHLLAKEIEAA